MAFDISQLQDWIGRTETAEDFVTPRLVAEYRATLGPHLASVDDGDAPLGLHWCLAPPIRPMAELGPDGHPEKGGFLPPVPLPRRMWAGGLVETFAPLRERDHVLRRSRIENIAFKQGRSGALCFVAVQHDYETERGLAIRERHDIVYREANAPSGASAGGEMASSKTAEPDVAWDVETSPTFLFRYSAMTFNGHRIHYDHLYSTEAEGYSGLVVHGPIQASLLLNITAVLDGRAPQSFEYRGTSPLTVGAPLRVLATRAADGDITAWSQTSGPRTCMKAKSSVMAPLS